VTFSFSVSYSQTLTWQTHVDTSTTFSSPRPADLNNDGVMDIIIGGGLDGSAEARGVVALDGTDGSMLWNFPTNEEIFASAQFMDITGDNIDDVFIGGRYAELYAIDGATGNMIWEFFTPPPTQAVDSGWFNFYSLQFIPDQNSDTYPEILASNGGNHALPAWDTLRDPGYLMIIDALTGNVLAKDTMPDGEETYCSPVAQDIDNDGTIDIIYGSGGENDKGSLWRTTVADLMNNDISNSIQLVSDPNLGFIAPVSLSDFNLDGNQDIVCQSYGGTAYLIDGLNNNVIWTYTKAGVESSSSPTIGNFIGDATPDVFLNLAKGAAPSFFDYYQVVLDGANGNVAWIDSIGELHFSSSGAVDIDRNGRDEIIASVNFHNGSNFSNQLIAIDVQGNQIINLHNPEGGVNLGSSPLILDVENDGYLDFVYAYRADSLNPMGAKGFKVNRLTSNFEVPTVGIAWGSYMGTDFDGQHTFLGTPCGTITVNQSVNNISCNNFNDGSIKLTPTGGVAPYTYIWSNGSISDSIGGLMPGNYTCYITDSTGCVKGQTINISDPYLLTFGGISGPTCPGEETGTASVNSTGCPCMFSGCLFNWSNGDSIKNASGLPSGYAVVTITHTDGCIVVDSVMIPEPAPIVDSVVISHQVCANELVPSGAISLFNSAAHTAFFLWDDNDSSPVHDTLQPGFHEVQLSDNRGCRDTMTFEVEAADTVIFNWSSNHVSCFGGADGSIVANATGGSGTLSYQWSSGSTSNTANNLPSGYESLTIIDSLNCAYSDSVMISEPSALTNSFSVTHETGNCDGAISSTIGGGTPSYSYSWNNGDNSDNNTALCEGTYILTVTDNNGCILVDSVEVLNTLSVSDIAINTVVYPNPTTDFVNIVNASNHPLHYSLFNNLGQLIMNGSSNESSIELDLSKYPKGLYLIHVDGGAKGSHTFRIEKI